MKSRPAGFNRGKYCQVCYESIKLCDNCGEELGKIGWCSSDGNHYCNEDCHPEMHEAIFNEEKEDGMSQSINTFFERKNTKKEFIIKPEN